MRDIAKKCKSCRKLFMFKYLSKNILCKSCLRKNIYLSEQKLKQYMRVYYEN